MITRLWKEIRALRIWFILMPVCVLVAFAMVQWFPPVKLPQNFSPDAAKRVSYENMESVVGQMFFFYQSALGGVLVLQALILNLAAASLFGAEFGFSSIQRFLSQPISRNRIWLEKSLTLLLLIVTALLADALLGLKCASVFDPLMELLKRVAPQPGWYHVFVRRDFLHDEVIPTLWRIFLLGLTALGTAPTLSLWLRQTHTTFWAALVCPVLFLAVYVVFLLAGQALLHLTANEFSLRDWLMDMPHWANEIPFLSYGRGWQFFLLAAVWFAIMYPIGWFKFRRLEV